MEPGEVSGSDHGAGAAAASSARRGRLFGALITLALVAVVVASFAAILLLRRGGPTLAPQTIAPGSAASAVSTANWTIYHDRLNLFTMRLPPEWVAKEPFPGGTYSITSPQGSYSGQTENITISDPALGDASASLQIDTAQIPDSALAHSDYCGARKQETATFNGYPADTRLPAVILFESANAHFQIDEMIPGSLGPINPGGPLNPPPPPTPQPAATVTADETLLAAALATFQPTDASPLACP